MLARPIIKREGKINLLIFHGSLDGFCPKWKKKAMPFSDEELIKQGFVYAAVGHYHSFMEIKDTGGRIFGIYTGTPAAQRLSDADNKSVVLGNIDDGGGVQIESLGLDKRKIADITVDITGLGYVEAVIEAIERRLAGSGVLKEDMVYVRLTGKIMLGLKLAFPDDFLSNDFFHVRIDTSAVKPDYNLEELVREKHIAGRFVQRLLKIRDKSADEHQKSVAEDAVYYGLDALTHGKVEVRGDYQGN